MMLQRLLTFATHRIYRMPILVLMPHSRCNCRCVMCDIWKANHEKKEISSGMLSKHITAFKRLGIRQVALSGGEALMHSNLWSLCDQLKSIGIKISLLSTGISLKAHASDVIAHVDEVIVSLDGSPEVHNKIRGLPQAFQKLRDGVTAIKEKKPSFRVTGRCVLQKSNYRDFSNIIVSAKGLPLDQISFLAADVSTTAFNRPDLWAGEKVGEVALNEGETKEFRKMVLGSFENFRELYERKFIAESPAKMLELVQYYQALSGEREFPQRRCNAPWVSAVVESDGEVRPCFFHESYGNIYHQEFMDILNSPKAVQFRRKLNVRKDPICKKCVCSLNVPWNE